MDEIGSKLYQIALGSIVILLAVVFALQFGGPQAQGCGSGGAAYAARVYGQTITDGDFKANYALAGFDRYPTEVAVQQNFREVVLNGLVERELLARAAEEVGFSATEDEVMRKLARDASVYLSLSVDAPPNMPSGEIAVPVRDNDGSFDVEQAKRFIQFGLRRSVTEFGEAQVRETLAQRMREMVLSTVTVSPEEVWDAFRQERDTATVSYVRFTPSYYGESLNPTEAELDAWIAENPEEVDRQYEANSYRYTGLEKQVRSRHILVRVDSGASDEVRAAAEARATALLGRAQAGEDFESLARENSDDAEHARRGGDLGYAPRGRQSAEFDEVQFNLEVDQISDVFETPIGFNIVKVIGIREGDVPVDEAKRELALGLFRVARAGELARAAAEEALQALSAGASLEELDAQLAGVVPSTDGTDGTDGTDELPERDSRAPQVTQTRPFGRGASPVTGISDNGPFVRAAFELSEDAPIPSEVIEAGGEFFVLHLDERNEVTREDMEAEVAERIHDGLVAAKQREALLLYVRQLRTDATAEGAILVNEATLSYEEEEQG